MAIFGALNALLKADSSQWKKGMGEARDEVDKTSARTKSFFKDLKSEFGKGSNAAQWVKLLAGGGAIAGIALMGRELEEVTGKVSEFANKLRDGGTGIKALSADLVRELPIFGSFVKTIDNIKEAFTGEELAFSKVEAGLKRMIATSNQAFDMYRKLQDDGKAFRKSLESEANRSREDAVLSALEGPARDRAQNDFKFNDTIKKLNDQLEANSPKSKIESLRKELEKENAKTFTTDAQQDEHKNKVMALNLEIKALNKERLENEKATDDAIAAARDAWWAELQVIDRREASKILEEQKRTKDSMESRRDELKKIIDNSERKPERLPTQITSNMRHGGIVQLAPLVNNQDRDQSQEVTKQSRDLLAKILEKLTQMELRSSNSSDFFSLGSLI